MNGKGMLLSLLWLLLLLLWLPLLIGLHVQYSREAQFISLDKTRRSNDDDG